MGECEITGQCEINAHYPLDPTGSWAPELTWVRADDKIHVSVEVIGQMDPEAWEFFTAKYEIYGWCGHQEDTRHARLKEAERE